MNAWKAEIQGGAFEAGNMLIPVVFKCPRAMRTKRDIKGTYYVRTYYVPFMSLSALGMPGRLKFTEARLMRVVGAFLWFSSALGL